MSTVALSTMWMQHRYDQVLQSVAAAGDVSLGAVEPSHIVTPSMMAGLIPGGFRIASLASGLPAEAIRVCEYDWYCGPEEGCKGYDHLERSGCLATFI